VSLDLHAASTVAITVDPRPRGVLPSNVTPALDGAASPFWSRASDVEQERPWLHPVLAFALTCVTFGLFGAYWLCDSWRQIRDHDGDTGKHPVAHTLAMVVPIYNLFRMHAHMRTIVELVRSFGGRTSLSPGTAVIVWIVSGALLRLSNRPHLDLLYVPSLMLEGALVAWGQAALNQAWSLKWPQVRVRPTHAGYWVAFGVGAVLSLFALVSFVLPDA
jgi:hypothetical protein